jgi:predicted outer membrane repeat protein
LNSTVSGNSAHWGGGIANVDVFAPGSAQLSMVNTTVSNNSSTESGGAIWSNGAIPSLANSIIDGDCVVSSAPTGSNNIESPGNSCGLTVPGNQVNVTTGVLNLGPLQDNGGLTPTHEPLPPSVAIDVIQPSECGSSGAYPGWYVPIDQRAIAGPQGSLCDVGSVEVELP